MSCAPGAHIGSSHRICGPYALPPSGRGLSLIRACFRRGGAAAARTAQARPGGRTRACRAPSGRRAAHRVRARSGRRREPDRGPLPRSSTSLTPASVTTITRARRSVLDGRRSASPAASSSSTVTTIVVLSSPTMRAISVCVNSPVIAVNSTEWARGEIPRSSSAAVNSVVSPWLARDSSQQRSDASGAGAAAASPVLVCVAIRTRIVRRADYLAADEFARGHGRGRGHGHEHEHGRGRGRGDPPAGYSIPSRSSRCSSARQ